MAERPPLRDEVLELIDNSRKKLRVLVAHLQNRTSQR
jgi:hypothetical protein